MNNKLSTVFVHVSQIQYISCLFIVRRQWISAPQHCPNRLFSDKFATSSCS